MAERQQQHRISLEASVVKSQHRRAWVGLASGWTVAMTGVVAGAVVAIHANSFAGAGIASASIVSLASVFLYGGYTRRHPADDQRETTVDSIRTSRSGTDDLPSLTAVNATAHSP